MPNFFKSFFAGKTENPEEEKQNNLFAFLLIKNIFLILFPLSQNRPGH